MDTGPSIDHHGYARRQNSQVQNAPRSHSQLGLIVSVLHTAVTAAPSAPSSPPSRAGMRCAQLVAATLACLLLMPGGAIGGPTRTSGTLQLRATFAYIFNEESCPPGVSVPAQVECFRFDGQGVVSGLGKATVTWHLIDDLADGLSCQHFNFTTIVVKVTGKGEIRASLIDPKTHCWTRPPVMAGPFAGTVTGGSGSYAGASGDLQVTENLTDEIGGAGEAIETWSGTLTVPSLEFDVTPPTLFTTGSFERERRGVCVSATPSRHATPATARYLSPAGRARVAFSREGARRLRAPRLTQVGTQRRRGSS